MGNPFLLCSCHNFYLRKASGVEWSFPVLKKFTYSWLFVLHVWCEEKSIVLAYIFINSILFVYLSTVQNNLLPFQFILYSIILSLLMRHCHEWLNIFATVWESIDKRYVLCSNMTYPLMRYLMIFVISSLLLASLTPLEKNFRYDSFKLHMLMVAVWWYYFSIVEFYRWIGKSAGKIGLWGTSYMYYSLLGKFHSSYESQRESST